jgi:hypothetical protein
MATVKQVNLPFRFGGEEHVGWLPPGAAKPLPTPVQDVLLTVEIQSDLCGFFLCWYCDERARCGDSWHRTLAEAEHAAHKQFGIEPAQWVTP